MEEIAQALGNSHGSVSTILHDRLCMLKLTARWVPKSLRDEQMTTRASVCSALLKRFRSKDDSLLHLVTVTETWVHYYEPDNTVYIRFLKKTAGHIIHRCLQTHVPFRGKVIFCIFSAFHICFVAKRWL